MPNSIFPAFVQLVLKVPKQNRYGLQNLTYKRQVACTLYICACICLRELVHCQGRQLLKIVLSPFWKGVYAKRKEFVPSFLFRVDPFNKGLGVQESKQEVIKVLSLSSPLNILNDILTSFGILYPPSSESTGWNLAAQGPTVAILKLSSMTCLK